MLARYLRWLMLVETGCYLVLAAWAHARGWVGLFGAAVLVLGTPLLLRALWAAALLPRRPPQIPGRTVAPALPPGRWLAALLTEWMAMIRVFGLIMPAEFFWMGRDHLRAAAGTTPVVLVPGYRCNRGLWLWLRQALEARGHVVATLNLEPLLGDIDGYAELLAARVEKVLERTQAKQVALVGHSMGGLVCLAYLRRHARAPVATFISIGTPFRGSRLAGLGHGRSARQMQPANPWLVALEHSPVNPAVRRVNIASLHDGYVPPESALQAGAEHHLLSGLGHLSMTWSPAVLNCLCAALEGHPRLEKAA